VSEVRESSQGIGERGENVSGPPWILGHRGSPLEAPENTLASLRRALDLGLDGVAYDVRACQSGELVLLSDETLDRTTEARGRLAEKTLIEISSLDAGGWFGARFKGERLALLEEALDLRGGSDRRPQHLVEIEERGLAQEAARLLAEIGPELSVRVASSVRDICLEARDAGLQAMLLAREASERDREFVRAERIAAYAASPAGWRTDAGREEWPCERWSRSVDDPADLLEACRSPINGFDTNEPLRALAVRALVHLAPADDGPYPLDVRGLDVTPGEFTAGRGDWCGRWSTSASVRNPFPYSVRVAAGVIPRHGAFDVEHLPANFELAPGETLSLPFTITGGSWRPGGDPLFFARFRWRRGPGRPLGSLLLDAPLKRTRTVVADVIVQRLTMLRESPADRDATMTVRRHRQHLLVSIESSGGWKDARTIVNLDGRFHYGGRGVRVTLPADFDQRDAGVAFSCGLQAVIDGEQRIRRWSGGVPDGLDCGAPGRLLPLRRA
jgi:Glycerophosphoryl diester phosphodiesterase family